MAMLLKTLIPILSSIALLLAAANTARSQTTSFTYDFYGDQPTNLIYEGDAHFPADSTYLRLTKTDDSGKALTWSAGRVLYPTPIKVWEGLGYINFETTIKFIIKANSGDDNPADGLAFFLEPVGSPIGAGGGSFGLFDSEGEKPNTFAVEFDIYSDSMDPSYRHVGIDIESQTSSSVLEVDGLVGQEVTARINYVSATKLISVYISAGSRTYQMQYGQELPGLLPREVQVGISASTGGSVAIHDVISWYFTATVARMGAEASIHQVV